MVSEKDKKWIAVIRRASADDIKYPDVRKLRSLTRLDFLLRKLEEVELELRTESDHQKTSDWLSDLLKDRTGEYTEDDLAWM